MMTQHNNIISSSSKSDELQKFWESYLENETFARSVFIWTLSVVEIPIMLLTLYALCFLIKSHRAASVFVIHLILSDLIQMICLILLTWDWTGMLLCAYEYSMIAGLYFMTCIAFERYVLVAHPMWHKTHQTLKSSCLISVIIWFVPLIFADIQPDFMYFDTLGQSLAYLIPYPVIILCFVGTWRGLSHAISLTSQKRKIILANFSLVLLSYTFLILPFASVHLFCYITDWKFWLTFPFQTIYNFVMCLLYLNPLADCLLYLLRTDAADVLPSLHCCCRSDTHQISVRYTTRTQSAS